MSALRSGTVGSVLAVAALVGGCRGDGGGSQRVYCDYVRGTVSFTRNQTGAGDAQNPDLSADGQLSSFAFVGTELQQTFTFRDSAPDSVNFTDLPRAVGAFATIVPGRADSVTLNTYLDGVLQEAATNDGLKHVQTEGRTEAKEYFGFAATKAFDEVELVVSTAGGSGGGSEYSIYEFCADAKLLD